MIQFYQDLQDYGRGFLTAAITVLAITLLTIILSWVFGLLAALAKRSEIVFFRKIAEFYIWFIRGTPALIQVFIIYFGVPEFGLSFSPLSQVLLHWQ